MANYLNSNYNVASNSNMAFNDQTNMGYNGKTIPVANNQLMNEALFGNIYGPNIRKAKKCNKPKCKKCREQKNCSEKSESCCEPKCPQIRCPVLTYDPNTRIPQAVTLWKASYLVANEKSRATHYDPAMVQPRGMAVHDNQLWVANTMSDKITNYDLFGNSILGPIQVRDNRLVVSFPAGVAINCNSGFNVPSPTAGARSAFFVTATKTGDICVYNPSVDPQNTVVIITNREAGEIAEYTGLTIANNVLYVADFYAGHIDVFGPDYSKILGFRFLDDYSANPIPLTYAPFNIVFIAPYIYILYAERQAGAVVNNVIGPGTGYISVFNLDGSFVRRFYSNGVLNSPWAMIPAPCEVGIPPGSFLVGNIGDGRINIFDPAGNFIGPLLAQTGIPMVIPGLQGLAANYTSINEIFFTASEDIETYGIMGSLVRDSVITRDG